MKYYVAGRIYRNYSNISYPLFICTPPFPRKKPPYSIQFVHAKMKLLFGLSYTFHVNVGIAFRKLKDSASGSANSRASHLTYYTAIMSSV